MSKLFAIFRREFIERVRTRAFLIGTLIGPAMFFFISKLPGLMLGEPTGAQAIAVVDASSGQVASRLLDSLRAEKVTTEQGEVERYRFVIVPTAPGRELAVRDSIVPDIDRRDAKGKVTLDAFTGLLIVTDSGLTEGRLTYLGRNVGSIGEINQFERMLRSAIVRERVLALGVSAEVARAATSKVELTTAKVTKGKLTGEKGESAFWLSYFLVLILFIAMMPTGVQVMSAVVEEKTNRILEVLVSSVRPFDLMLGKIFGVGAATMLQLAIWAGSATILGRFGAANAAAAQAAGASAQQKVAVTIPAIPTDLILVTLLYFAIGFLFFTSAYAAVGAMCTTVQETQQAQFPVMIMMLAGYGGAFAAMGQPEGLAARVLTYLPPTAPFIVPTRWSSSPLPLSELLASLVVCSIGVVGMVWFAAKIYRVGILSYGKKPSFKDIWSWVRHS